MTSAVMDRSVERRQGGLVVQEQPTEYTTLIPRVAPPLARRTGDAYVMGAGLAAPALHKIDESRSPIWHGSWTWFAECGSHVVPSEGADGWRYCAVCWDGNARRVRALAFRDVADEGGGDAPGQEIDDVADHAGGSERQAGQARGRPGRPGHASTGQVGGPDVSPELMAVERTADRAAFVPDLIWVPVDGGYRAVSRVDDPDAWAAAVEADEPVVTQVDDGWTPATEIGRFASSSSSQPSIVEKMEDAVDARQGMRLLEIGTGTGWTSARWCDQLGDGGVVTVELDPTLASRARDSLDSAGYAPAVIVGNGADGYASGGPYDRVSATCAVDRVPYAWVEQTKPNGLIVTPFGLDFHNGWLLRLVVHEDGTAAGRFVEPLAFMRIRDQRRPDCPWGGGDGPGDPNRGISMMSSKDVFEVIGPAALAIGLRVPSCHMGRDEHQLHVTLHDPLSGSWARCQVKSKVGPQVITQYGPRRLWNEVEEARTWWVREGKPGLDRFGVTVSPEGQSMWLGDPSNKLRYMAA